MTHNENGINTFHLLAFPKDKTIRSIRDLTVNHVRLLTDMTIRSKDYIYNVYSIPVNQIECHCHCPPSVMLLHIHFELVNNKKYRKPLREHAVSRIIENLLVDSDYYKKIIYIFIFNYCKFFFIIGN